MDGYRLSPDYSREELRGGGADFIHRRWSGMYKKENAPRAIRPVYKIKFQLKSY